MNWLQRALGRDPGRREGSPKGGRGHKNRPIHRGTGFTKPDATTIRARNRRRAKVSRASRKANR
jgi:hypothetical protein